MALSDLAVALDVDSQATPTKVGWEHLREVYRYAVLALEGGDELRYQVACKRSLVLFRQIDDAEGTTERWNALFHLSWIAVMGHAELSHEDWALLKMALNEYASDNNPRVNSNAGLLLAATMYRTKAYSEAARRLDALDFPPFHNLFLALSLEGMGKHEEARARFYEADQQIDTWAEREASEDLRVARLLRNELARGL